MKTLPSFKACLRKNLTDSEYRAVVKEIRKTEGVLSAAFNKTAKEVNVTYKTGVRVREKIARIDGVRALKPLK